MKKYPSKINKLKKPLHFQLLSTVKNLKYYNITNM